MLACIDSESFITCEGWMFYIVITIFFIKKELCYLQWDLLKIKF